MQLGWLLKRFTRAKLNTKLYVILILPASVLLFYTLSHLNISPNSRGKLLPRKLGMKPLINWIS